MKTSLFHARSNFLHPTLRGSKYDEMGEMFLVSRSLPAVELSEAISPQVDDGRFARKRWGGEAAAKPPPHHHSRQVKAESLMNQ